MMKAKPTSSEVLDLLQDAGLTENEATVYKFLVENGGAATKDLIRKLRFRQPQIYDITAALERKHFINVLESRPKRFIPSSMEVLLDQRLKDLRDSRMLLLKWSASANGGETKQPAMWMSRDWESFVNNTANVIMKSKQSICMEATPAIAGEFQSAVEDSISKGVDSVLLVYGIDRRKYENECLKRDSKLFKEIRYLKPGQFFAAIGDTGGATFMPRAVTFRPPGERYGYVFKDSDVAWFLTHSFFVGWFKSEELFCRDIELPKRYDLHRLAVSDMIRLKGGKHGSRITATVGGITREGREMVELTGSVKGVVAQGDIVNFTLESGGKTYVIGGYDSIVEDIEASWVRIEKCM